MASGVEAVAAREALHCFQAGVEKNQAPRPVSVRTRHIPTYELRTLLSISLGVVAKVQFGPVNVLTSVAIQIA